MLFVKTEVRPSAIQGLGLFAAEDIPEGALIARFDPCFGSIFNEGDLESLPAIARDFIRRYGWRGTSEWDGFYLMDVDDSRYMNHSLAPSMSVSAEGGFTARAARNIAAGEELTENYRLFDPDFDSYGSGWAEGPAPAGVESEHERSELLREIERRIDRGESDSDFAFWVRTKLSRRCR